MYDADDLIITKPVKPKALFEAVQKALLIQTKENPNHTRSNRGNPVGKFEKDFSVLLVEDHEVNQRVFTMLMDRMGIGFDIANNGDQAIDMLKEEKFDIIFMDIHMPGMDGIETARWIRSKLKNEQTYIIAMTADDRYANGDLLENTGINEYISKPIHLDSLQEVLSKAVSRTNKRKHFGFISGETQITQNEYSFEVDNKVIDVDVLFGYFPQSGRGDYEALLEMIELFLDEYPERINDLHLALECEDYELGRKTAHTIKGASLTFGAIRLSKTAKDLEDALLIQNREDINRIVRRLDREYITAIDELRRMVEQS
jgi:CheY-like chemotaxis protein/HPt (histidine-containing phosphotransfer) domain-containing protein